MTEHVERCIRALMAAEGHHVRVSAIRDPDTAEPLGWLALCRCGGYGLFDMPEWELARSAAVRHVAGERDTEVAPHFWRWPVRFAWRLRQRQRDRFGLVG